MRLGSYIVLEAATAIGLLGGGAWGATALSRELRGRGEATDTVAVTAPGAGAVPDSVAGPDSVPVADSVAVAVPDSVPVPVPDPDSVPVPDSDPDRDPDPDSDPDSVPDSDPDRDPDPDPVPDPGAGSGSAPALDTIASTDPSGWAFAGVPDEPLLAPLRTGVPKRMKTNRGGTSLSLRVDLDNGARAAFKPDQIFGQSNPRREVAAYRIDRLLGIGRVPPAIPVSYPMDVVMAAVDAPQRARVRAEAVPRQGVLRGELSWWIPVIEDAYVEGFRIDETDGILTWRRWLKAGATIPPQYLALCQQLSAMALFDFVIDNTDRWTGNNAKVSEDKRVLYFMDNTLAFGKSRTGHNKTYLYLQRSQTFSRRLVERLRALTEAELRTVLTTDAAPFEQLLTDEEIAAVLARRDRALAYVDGLVAKHGEDKVLAFP